MDIPFVERVTAEELGRMYQTMTQDEIGAAFGVHQATVGKAIKRFNIQRKTPGHRNTSGISNPCWKGTRAGYHAFHKRVQAIRGRPSLCEQCGKSDPSMAYQWANLTGRYHDIEDYKRMCVSCHRKYDQRRKNPGVFFDGKTQPLSAWEAELSFNHNTIRARLRAGWSIPRAMTTPAGAITRWRREVQLTIPI